MCLRDLVALSVSAVFLVPVAFATPVLLPPGGSVTAFAPTTSAFSGSLVGTYSMGFSNAFENGTVFEEVYDSGGTMDFYYKVTNNASSPDSLSRITVGGYTGFTTSVDYLLNSADAPTSANRQAVGDSVGFFFSVTPGTSSDWLEVATNATAFDDKGTIALIDTLPTDLANVLEPAVSTPEPLSLGLVSGGLLIAGLVRRRRGGDSRSGAR